MKTFCVILGMAIVLLTTSHLAEAQQDTKFATKSICINNMSWIAFIDADGKVINIEQELVYAHGGLRPQKCSNRSKKGSKELRLMRDSKKKEQKSL